MKKLYPFFAIATAVLASSGSFVSSAFAGEGLFSRAYTAETVPAGHFELEQLVRYRTKRAYGTYNALDLKSEVEYGLSDALQLSFYVNTQYLDAKGAPDDNDPAGDTPQGFSRSGFRLTSLSSELLYRVTSPVTDPVGFAFAVEPEWDIADVHNGLKEYDSMEFELRFIVQKNFLSDQLIVAYNMVLEPEYFRYGNSLTDQWTAEFDWNHELGATYRVAANWYAGLELRNHNELDSFHSHDHSVFWGGPVAHFGGEKLWATLGVLYQFTGNPDGTDEAGSFRGDGRFLHSHELWETTFKVGMPL
jgi:hypothetical protein